MKKLPDWVRQFNKKHYVDKYLSKYLSNNWMLLYNDASYLQSQQFNKQYEGLLRNTLSNNFPVRTSDRAKTDPGVIRLSPFGNTLTLDLAKEAIRNEKLGELNETDFLTISLSSTDYLGHLIGPNAIGIEDTYLRLDRDLGEFFSFLDRTFGDGTYTIFLTADHGAAHNVRFLMGHGIPAGKWDPKESVKSLNQFLFGALRVSDLVINIENNQVNLNYEKIRRFQLDQELVITSTINWLNRQEGVKVAFDMRKATTLPDAILQRVVNGYNSDRSGIIQIILNPGWLNSSTMTGTTHGSWSPYDTHIPLLFYGWGIKSGHSNQSVHITDIAPTIAALLHIQPPNGNVGTPITELFLDKALNSNHQARLKPKKK